MAKQGFKELNIALSKTVSLDKIKSNLDKHLTQVVKEAQRMCPVKTGNLKRSGAKSIEAGNNSFTGRATFGGVAGTGNVEGSNNVDIDYARLRHVDNKTGEKLFLKKAFRMESKYLKKRLNVS